MRFGSSPIHSERSAISTLMSCLICPIRRQSAVQNLPSAYTRASCLCLSLRSCGCLVVVALVEGRSSIFHDEDEFSDNMLVVSPEPNTAMALIERLGKAAEDSTRFRFELAQHFLHMTLLWV